MAKKTGRPPLRLEALTLRGTYRLKEYREAELCTSVGAWRGASALLRSALEKTLKANGYTGGSLFDKINWAAAMES